MALEAEVEVEVEVEGGPAATLPAFAALVFIARLSRSVSGDRANHLHLGWHGTPNGAIMRG